MNYRVKIENVDVNPEYGVEKEEQEGIDCNGFLLIAFGEETKECQNVTCSIHGVTVAKIADFLEKSDDDAKYVVLEAAAMAEGYRKAEAIYREQSAKRSMGRLEQIFGGGLEDEDD